MNPSFDTVLAEIAREQQALRARFEALGQRLDAMDARLARLAVGAPPPETQPSLEVTAEPPPLPGPMETAVSYAQPALAASAGMIAPEAAAPAAPNETPAGRAAEAFSPAAARPDGPRPLPNAAWEKESIELRLGTYWLARIGVLLVLTGLVFLGNYVYQRHIVSFGPAGKLALLALAGAALTGAGLWLEKWRAEMKNYGRVVLAGGLAALYYTAYAAHFVERLRVIGSPLAGGALLLAVAAGLVWIAEKRRSSVLAVLVVLFSFYTGAMNPLHLFSLFSNLLLCGVAAYCVLRRGWAQVGWAGLLGSYASFGFWRLHQEGAFAWGTGLPMEDFWMSRGFLLAYWVLFAAAGLLGSVGKGGAGRAGFLTLNNAAFFAYVALGLWRARPEAYWIFCAIFGAVLLGLSWWARRRQPEDSLTAPALLAQGLAVLTLALFGKLQGPALPFALAVESVLLAWFGGRVQSLRQLYWAGAVIVGLLVPVAWPILEPMKGAEAASPKLALGVAVIFGIGSGVARWVRQRRFAPGLDVPATAYALAMAVCGLLALPWLRETAPSLWMLALGTAAVVAALSVSLRWTGVLEAAAASRLWLLLAAALVMEHGSRSAAPGLWLLMAGAALGTASAWRHGLPSTADKPWRAVAAVDLLLALVLYLGWCEKALPPAWMYAVASLSALALVLAGAWRGWRGLAALGAIAISLVMMRLIFDAAMQRTSPGAWMAPAALLAMAAAPRWLAGKEKSAGIVSAGTQGICAAAAALAALLLAADQADGVFLTLAWTGLGVVFFALGFAGVGRAGRLAGLALLGAALARVFLRDVWELDTLGRILSFLALGAGLLVLGFVYNRFRDAIAKWL